MADSETDYAHTTQALLDTAVSAIGGAPRPGQNTMAQAVSKAFHTQRHLAVQAGTGTGKSLAYLVPAIEYAHETNSTVVVSTATIALQNQLVNRDLPRLREALRTQLSRDPSFALIKGRSHYVCLNKLHAPEDLEAQAESLIEPEQLSNMGEQILELRTWAAETDTGDRADLEISVSDLVWKQVSVSAQECVGAKNCPHSQDCFSEKARLRAHDVDIVVTNHSLLAIDSLFDANVLPEHDVVVLDEAHELSDRITAAAADELSATALSMAARRAEKLGAQVEKLLEVIKEWSAELEHTQAGRLLTLPTSLLHSSQALRQRIDQCCRTISAAPANEAADHPTRHAERLSLANVLQSHSDCFTRAFESLTAKNSTTDEPDRDVVWVSHDDRRGSVLHIAPLAVSDLLGSHLFARKTVVLTSATLSIGGNFNAMAAHWGLPAGKWDGIDVGTPFHPEKAGILYLPTHLPLPGRDGLSPETLDEIHELIMAVGGRTLGLFSSRSAAVEAAQAMRTRLPFDVLCQGDDATSALIRRFSKEENTCLFGTLSLWQGVDVPGSSCSLVIIDKIPFPRPDDPLLQARKENADQQRRNGFMEVSATHAALLMAQGAGRLLRSIDDRGVVAVLDKRIVLKSYGSFIRASMPSFWCTSDPTVVRGALKRLRP
ncbi:ATP-dependent DNA helicase [Corynebacterium sp. sy017]|uniref:ATP-dependent DNA helicase n=1 Tax=unclassified Corynebacterium TaxID=2624378 RepID=UPI0011864E27|nr:MULTISPECIES: ATP-dependent DNA helicase [unclassified Corynebacterium]MBP3088176.1 ATP-dependent DNA helicase [Corynebacterium sp. sy017]TSD92679.1 ATP-dependent DNA helicase [Corynebacterium sp. SY003]